MLSPTSLKNKEAPLSILTVVVMHKYQYLIEFSRQVSVILDMREVNDAAAFDIMTSLAFGRRCRGGTDLLGD